MNKTIQHFIKKRHHSVCNHLLGVMVSDVRDGNFRVQNEVKNRKINK